MGKQLARLSVVVALIGAVCLNVQPAHAVGPICRVNPSAPGPTHDGSSWDFAFTNLAVALGTAGCQEVWVAAAVYRLPGSEYDTFVVRPGSAVYGGFDGSELIRDDRDPAIHLTILSGDMADDDDTNAQEVVSSWLDINGTNNRHVVSVDGITSDATSTTVLDGFTITGGNAPEGHAGGGLDCTGSGADNNCSPTLKNLVFRGNRAAYGGGAIANNGSGGGESSPTIQNVVFIGNYAERGGAVYNAAYGSGLSSPTLLDVTFYGNAGVSGGAVYNDAVSGGTSSPSLTNVTFSENAADNGGAVYNRFSGGASSPTFTNVVFDVNEATGSGGAVYNDAPGYVCNLSFTDVTFSENEAGWGGAIYSDAQYGTGSSLFSNVTFDRNHSHHDGGAVYGNAKNGGISNPSFTNATFSGNSADGHGGAIYNATIPGGTASPHLTNVTFNANHAELDGGAIYDEDESIGPSAPVLTNVILWGDTAVGSGDEIFDGTGDAVINHSVVQGGDGGLSTGTAFSSGTGNLSTDPRLGLLQDNGGFTETIGILVGSSAFEAGDDLAAPLHDQRGEDRPAGLHSDIGAYEAPVVSIHGNTGLTGTRLGYLDVLPKTVTADGTGDYQIFVMKGWSGTVTPFKMGYAFEPARRTYTTLRFPPLAPNYVASAYPRAGTYDGNHANWANSGAWVSIPIEGLFGGTLEIGANMGGTATFPFYGSGFSLTYLKYTGWGKIGVYLDGGATPITTIDTSGAVDLPTYTSPALIPGPHTLMLKHAGPAGSLIGIDSLAVTTPLMVESPDTLDGTDADLSYTGAWTSMPITGLYNDTLHLGLTAGSASTVHFNGSGFKLSYLQYSNWGIIALLLDGSQVPFAVINTHGSPAIVTYTSPALNPGEHVLIIYHAGPAGRFIGLDSIELLPGPD